MKIEKGQKCLQIKANNTGKRAINTLYMQSDFP